MEIYFFKTVIVLALHLLTADWGILEDYDFKPGVQTIAGPKYCIR